MSKTPEVANLRSRLLCQAALGGRRGSQPQPAAPQPPPKPPDKTCAEISMKDFLDFLKTAYQVNEAIDGVPSDFGDKNNIDWKKLTSNTLVAELKEKEVLEETVGGATSPRRKKEGTLQESGCETQSKSASRQNSIDQTFERLAERRDSCDRSERRPSSVRTERRSSLMMVPQRRKQSLGGVSVTARAVDGGTKVDRIMKKKLNEVLQEGILDSVLPYLLPKQQQNSQAQQQPSIKKFLANNDLKRMGSTVDKGDKQAATGLVTKEKKESQRRKSSVGTVDGVNKPGDKKDVEVVIHVCDEMKNLKKDFKCAQKLLVSQMGYFAEVTTGQKLEDMDISVHCDITIFDWLIRWVKKESVPEESWPVLDTAIVVPVLMSSAFLQMDSLQEHCLEYCRTHINEILRDSSNLGCINDAILTRLASMFSNNEIENLKDRKDKLQGKLYCKLIGSLNEPKPNPARGHYNSAATLFKCGRCGKLIVKRLGSLIQCVHASMTMDRSGHLVSSHVRDSTWTLTDHLKDLKTELKTWRRVYWRLWANCHLLSCSVCHAHFPLHQMSWCKFHAESAQFFSMENQRSMTFPIGRHPCCGERAYRFEVLQGNAGCQYRDHTPETRTQEEKDILRLWSEHKELIKQDPPTTEAGSTERRNSPRTKDAANVVWWEGLELAPPRPKVGLLAKVWDNVIRKEDSKKTHRSPLQKQPSTATHPPAPGQQQQQQQQSQLTADFSSYSDSDTDADSSSSQSGDSEESFHPQAVRVTAKPKGQPSSSGHHPVASARNDGSRFWVSKLSTRCNQDNQREFEERAIRQMEYILTRKTSGESLASGLRTVTRSSYYNTPPGGTYVKVEADWREAHCSSHGCPGSTQSKLKNSASYSSGGVAYMGSSKVNQRKPQR